MGVTRTVLNSKAAQRFRRILALKTGLYCKVKKLSPSISEEMRTARLLTHFNIQTVIDVGANTGQFAESLIDFGYKGKIVSFEPVESAYAQLSKRAKKYPNWQVAERCAIGNTDGIIEINVSEDTVFSSIKTIKKEKVPIFKLDTLAEKYFNNKAGIFLKIDTQGFEKEVLEGASELFKIVKGIKIEIPLCKDAEVYENVEWDINDYLKIFNDANFQCMSLDAIGANKETGIVNEVDGVFIR